jgi:hypothetical protein
VYARLNQVSCCGAASSLLYCCTGVLEYLVHEFQSSRVPTQLPGPGVKAVLAGVSRAEARDLPHERIMRVILVLRLDLCEQGPQAGVI